MVVQDFSKVSIEALMGKYIINKEILQKTIEEMDLSIRTYNCLKRAGMYTVENLINKTEDDMCKVRNMGRKCVDEIIEKLHLYDLKLMDEFK